MCHRNQRKAVYSQQKPREVGGILFSKMALGPTLGRMVHQPGSHRLTGTYFLTFAFWTSFLKDFGSPNDPKWLWEEASAEFGGPQRVNSFLPMHPPWL